MAHFAKLNDNNIVTQVVVVSMVDTCNEEGFEVEEIGQKFLQNLYGQEDKWVKTSYNGNIRKNYAGIGYEYNEKLDAFIAPKPFDSWVLDEKLCCYVAPIKRPEKEGKIYFWNEQLQVWNEEEFYAPITPTTN